ncbi:FprA family A-type flavoprotein [Sulfidibacter corallicola]|uniref:FprA family A-type flavoprotein n=1 Tax=Sulfidibacter corallicola TaxID=2818388 RepID=A0A8A4TGN8_SULCO|nr:MBL fold metallo-hydrolase [Sulfidibacter corallicola]QTD48720.1 FprA family A-type flavoprotein [Sulfidibacter corallicola]
MDILFENDTHRNVWLDDFGHGLAVQANQHLILHDGVGMILDPGGHKAFKPTLAQLSGLMRTADLRYLFLSHQDPDIVAALNGWMLATDAEAYCSKLWVRFVPHFGLDKYLEHRLHSIPDEGMMLELGDARLHLLPAHFLHSAGNFQVYDPISRILYTGDLGASLGADYSFVSDFEAHRAYMEPFHQRYMACNKAMRAWARMARRLDIEIIAPQHGAAFRGKEMVHRFIEWCESLDCGIDLLNVLFENAGKVGSP